MSRWHRYSAAIRTHRSRLFDAVLVLAIAVTTATGDGGAARSLGPHEIAYFDWNPPLWFSIPVGALVGAAVWWRRRWPVAVVVAGVFAWATLAAFVALLFAQYTIAERTRSWWKVAASTLATALVVGIPIWAEGGLDAAGPLSAVICAAPALLGLYVGTRRELAARVRERAEREQHQRILQARSDERAQIARDMHDVVTHRVSLMVLHSTALEATEGQDAVTIGKRIGTIGRESLEELRSLVQVLRADDDAPLAPQPGLADLTDLVAASRRIGLPVTLEVVDKAGVRPPALVEHALYRVAQEALINVHKHAAGARTHICVTHAPDALRLVVTNDPGRRGSQPGLPGGGHGLLGIAERIRLVGGELTAGPLPHGGFEIAAEVPLKPVPKSEDIR
ncbi:sensor histidine kinase [Plantactinospora mayteni]|uniref:histidine kinase n=1 Tax=Plantactinospora mayteni TaxID=566021 RepID=A0ABQ4EQZ7_9ACTN|nr:histidine kinase [Plantactinospora mayteni]GIG97064.1 two-component sensor histidine kinase [Plantactinospora mayteni]